MRIRPDSVAFTILLGALAALPPLSIDMGLPALGQLHSSLLATPAQATLTLSVFLAGFAIAQLIAGPLSDRFGRRPLMLGGLALYAVAGMLCAAAPTMSSLLVCRLLAGIGAAGAATLVLAVARDVFDGHVARLKISNITMVITLAPIIAPSLGVLMLSLGGWRFIYGLLAAAGGLLFLAVLAALPETRRLQPGTRLDLRGRYAAVLAHRRTMGYTLVGGMGAGSLFSFIASAPHVLMDRMGASPGFFAALFAITSAGILVGSAFNSWLARRRVASSVPLAWGLVLSPCSGIGASMFLIAGVERLETFVPFIVLTGFCRGLVNPNAAHAALEALPQHAGVASALLGCSQMMMAALSGAVVAALFPSLGPLAITLAITFFGLAGLLAWCWVEAAAPAQPDLA